MSNFVEAVGQGKLGKNKGLPTGIDSLDLAINGIQKTTSIGVAAAPKVGKTTLTDYAFVISPYLYMEKIGKLPNIEWIYFSYEIDRISKEFKYAAFFMAHDFGVYNFEYESLTYLMSQDYLSGKLLRKDSSGKAYVNSEGEHEIVKLSDLHDGMLREIYVRRIVPIFGEHDANGNKVREGKIDYVEESENPTGLEKYIKAYAKRNGTFVTSKYWTLTDEGKSIEKERIIGYKENNTDKFTIIIVDHIRKLRDERGFTKKQVIDKWLEYSTYLRNMCKFTFINVCHSNRGISNTERLKFHGEWVFPTADDVKDTGNLAEESTMLITMFNPNDEKYNLRRHFKIDLLDIDGREAHPNYRSIHLAESRYTDCPRHIQVNMLGGVNMFIPLNL